MKNCGYAQKENDIILHAKPHKSYGLVSKAFNIRIFAILN